LKIAGFLILALFLTVHMPAEAVSAGETPAVNDPDSGEADSPLILPPRDKMFLFISEGVTAAWVTRIIKQNGRSDFVFKDFLPGLYMEMQLRNFKLFTPLMRLAAYYPLSATFNDMPNLAKTPLHYGADMLLGPNFELDKLKYIRFNFAPALHLFFQNSDRWNYFHIGGAGLLGIEFPLTVGWTVLVDGVASLDNGNLGNNKDMEPIDITYQYQVGVGVRYSKKGRNQNPYIKPGFFRNILTKFKSDDQDTEPVQQTETALDVGTGAVPPQSPDPEPPAQEAPEAQDQLNPAES